MDNHLTAKCGPVCRSTTCAEMVKQAPTGRWYITMGHAGFNTTANNRNGYATMPAAVNAAVRCATSAEVY